MSKIKLGVQKGPLKAKNLYAQEFLCGATRGTVVTWSSSPLRERKELEATRGEGTETDTMCVEMSRPPHPPPCYNPEHSLVFSVAVKETRDKFEYCQGTLQWNWQGHYVCQYQSSHRILQISYLHSVDTKNTLKAQIIILNHTRDNMHIMICYPMWV